MRVQKTPCMWKDYIWNPAKWSYENSNYLASIIDDSVITCDEIIYAVAVEKNSTC